MTSVVAEWPGSSLELKDLFAAQAKALGVLRNAPRTSKSHFGMYADLATLIDTIREPLAANGLAFSQSFCIYDEHHDVLVTTLHHESGQFVRSFNRIKTNLAPQQYAATATYMKRVALAAIVGVAAEDEDDGETATRAAVASNVEDEARIEKMGMAKLREAKTDEERADILAKAEKRVQEGTLSREALVRLASAAVDAAVAKPKPAATTKSQAARTPAAAAT